MKAEQFEEILERQIKMTREILVEKAKQYADDNDRLHNFRVGAALTGETPEQVLWGFLVKHLVSISDMVGKDDFYPTDVWDEKIGDAVNYLILLRAQVFETDNQRTSAAEVPPSSPPTVVYNMTNIHPPATVSDEHYDPLS